MSLQPASPGTTEPAPADIEIVKASADSGTVRIVLDVPIGATVQITVEAVPANSDSQAGTDPLVTVKTALVPELAARPAVAQIASAPEPGRVAVQPRAALGPAMAAYAPEAADAAPMVSLSESPPVEEALPRAMAQAVAENAPTEAAAAAPRMTENAGYQNKPSDGAVAQNAPVQTALVISPPSRLSLPARARGWRDGLVAEAKASPLVTIVFALALLIYVVTRLWGIDRFPVFFYSDEANYVSFANDLEAHGLRGSDGQLLPLYFEADTNRYAPLTDVYFQMVSSFLFGNSIFVARATNALISILGVVAISLILKIIFKARLWWSAILILGIVPAYFLYSRVVFEMIIMLTFYSVLLLCYLLYRTRSPNYAYLVLVAGAATFYSYSAAQPMVLLAGALLLISDFRYHLQHWRTWLKAAPLAALLVVPFVRFRLAHPDALEEHLRAILSYWGEDIPLVKKIGIFIQDYGYALSPQYWFLPNAAEDPVLPNQHIPGRANFGLEWLPFVLIGLWICLRHIRDTRYRAILLAALAVPMGSVLDSVEIRRLLAMLAPLAIFVGLGLDWIMTWLDNRLKGRFSLPRQTVVVFAVLAIANGWMLRDALVNGPTYTTDYGLFGVQYGVKQIFEDTLPKYLKADANLRVAVTPVFANNTQDFPRFFYSEKDQQRVTMGVIYDYLRVKQDLTDTIMVMDAQEYDFARTSPELKSLQVEETLYYPDGSPDFYITRPVYVDDIDQVIAEQRAARLKPLTTHLPLYGQSVTVSYSVLGSGDISQVFDGSTDSVVRGLEANPFTLGLTFQQPRAIHGAALTIGSLDDVTIKAVLTPPSGAPVTYEQEYKGLPPDPTINLTFPNGPAQVLDIHFEIKNNLSGDSAQIHVRELVLN